MGEMRERERERPVLAVKAVVCERGARAGVVAGWKRHGGPSLAML